MYRYAVERPVQSTNEISKQRGFCGWISNQNVIELGEVAGDVTRTHGMSQSAFDPVARDGVAELFRNSEAEAGLRVVQLTGLLRRPFAGSRHALFALKDEQVAASPVSAAHAEEVAPCLDCLKMHCPADHGVVTGIRFHWDMFQFDAGKSLPKLVNVSRPPTDMTRRFMVACAVRMLATASVAGLGQ